MSWPESRLLLYDTGPRAAAHNGEGALESAALILFCLFTVNQAGVVIQMAKGIAPILEQVLYDLEDGGMEKGVGVKR